MLYSLIGAIADTQIMYGTVLAVFLRSLGRDRFQFYWLVRQIAAEKGASFY